MENKQKEIIKQSHKKMGAFNSYASPQFLSKKISDGELPHAKKVEKENDTFVSKSDKYTMSIPLTATGDILFKKSIPKSFKSSMLKRNDYSLSISLPNQNTNTFLGKAKVARDNSIIYKDYQESTDVIVQALNKSSRILTVMHDADAPTEYKYTVNLRQGDSLKKLKDGGVFILDKNKNMLGFFAPPWAIDKNGKNIPTHYKIDGNTLTQVVNHLNINATYPIVADPYYGYTMVDAGQWISDSQSGGNPWFNYRLFIFPSSASRWFHSEYAGAAGWNEIKSFMAYTQGSNNNETSLRNQYICHVQNAWIRPGSYHLEQWRPPTSYWRTVLYGCNPPGLI